MPRPKQQTLSGLYYSAKFRDESTGRTTREKFTNRQGKRNCKRESLSRVKGAEDEGQNDELRLPTILLTVNCMDITLPRYQLDIFACSGFLHIVPASSTNFHQLLLIEGTIIV